MAQLWSHEEEGNHYEVRSAGASIRLYRNGVNHSQWNPNRPLAGSIWDLISLPALYRPRGHINDALILGFGAGAVGRQLSELAGIQRIVGLELDPMHLSIAQGFFGCGEEFDLVAGDAVEWVNEENPRPQYDLIVDDLYGEEDGVPVRFAPMDADWFLTLSGLLREGGILVLNMIEPEKVDSLPLHSNEALQDRFPHGVMYQIDGYENRVCAFSDQPFSEEKIAASIRSICRDYPRCYGVANRYKISVV